MNRCGEKMNPVDEKKLVERAKNGDAKAYANLFKTYYKGIYDYVMRRVQNRSDAEDLTMDVFTHGYEAIASFEERGVSIKAWFYRIAHNAVIDHYRKTRQTLPIEKAYDSAEEVDIESEIISKSDIEDIRREMLTLSTAQSEVLLLRFVKDLSVAETAYVLGKEEATVRALQFKGIRNLRKRIRETGEGSVKRATQTQDIVSQNTLSKKQAKTGLEELQSER